MHLRSIVAVMLAAVMVAAPATGWAASNRARTLAGATAAMSDQRPGGPRGWGPWGMSEAELQGAGCVASGAAATFAAYATNANEVVMVVAGGVFAPSTPTLLGIVMLSTVFTSGCAVGAIAAPFGYWLYRQATPQAETGDEGAVLPDE